MPLTLLAATDLSAPSRHAIDRGFLLAAACQGRYRVVHALPEDPVEKLLALFGDAAQRLRQNIEDTARHTLSEWLNDPRRHQGVGAEPVIQNGEPLAVIAEQADACDASLILIGARGEDFLRHSLIGSTASRLLRKTARHPVLVVKQAPHDHYRCPLIAIDFSPASRQAIHLGKLFAPMARPVLLHAFELPFESKLSQAGASEETLHQARRQLREASLHRLHTLAASAGLETGDYTPLVLHGPALQHLLAQEQEQDADLIILGKHGQHTGSEMLLGGTTKHVLNDAQCDVLVIADPRRPEGF